MTFGGGVKCACVFTGGYSAASYSLHIDPLLVSPNHDLLQIEICVIIVGSAVIN